MNVEKLSPIRIVFMGTPDFAIPALSEIHNSRHQLVAVVTIPDKKAGRGRQVRPSAVKEWALDHQYPLLQPDSLEDPVFLNNIRDCQADVFVVVAFRILPPQLYEIPPFGSVNIHASLLPRYRGAAPIQRALMKGETETGVTIFQIEKKVDTGGILMQERIPIQSEDQLGDLWQRLAQCGGQSLLPALEGLISGKITPCKQDDSISSRAPKIQKKDTQINWQRSAEVIHNQIRALSPCPGASSLLGGKKIKLLRARISQDKVQDLEPGEIQPMKDHLNVGTGSGILEVLEVHPEGKRRQTTKEYLQGHKFAPDTYFND